MKGYVDTRGAGIQVRNGPSRSRPDGYGGGIGTYLDLACRSGIVRSLERHVKARKGEQGYGCLTSSIAGDVEPGGRGVCRGWKQIGDRRGILPFAGKALNYGLSRKGRRGLKKRWRKEKIRSVSSSSSVFRYLAEFHDKGQNQLRKPGKAFIPAAKEALNPVHFLQPKTRLNFIFLLCLPRRSGRSYWGAFVP